MLRISQAVTTISAIRWRPLDNVHLFSPFSQFRHNLHCSRPGTDDCNCLVLEIDQVGRLLVSAGVIVVPARRMEHTFVIAKFLPAGELWNFRYIENASSNKDKLSK